MINLQFKMCILKVELTQCKLNITIWKLQFFKTCSKIGFKNYNSKMIISKLIWKIDNLQFTSCEKQFFGYKVKIEFKNVNIIISISKATNKQNLFRKLQCKKDAFWKYNTSLFKNRCRLKCTISKLQLKIYYLKNCNSNITTWKVTMFKFNKTNK